MTRQKDRAAMLAVFAGVLLVYCAFVTRNYYWDGIHFAYTIENAASLRELLHPNHLIYNFVGCLVYSTVNLVVPGTRSLCVLQYLNCILGALCAAVMFRILRTVVGSASLAAALAVLFASSATWWKYSTDADAYVASILGLLICFYLILPARKPRPFSVAAVHVAAMCFHQLAVFFFPVIVVGLVIQTHMLPNRKRSATVGVYILTAAGATLGIYASAFYWMTGGLDPGNFLSWITAYSPEIGFVFDAGESLKYTLRGSVQLFFGGRFSFLNEVPTALSAVVLASMAGALAWLIAGLVRKGSGPSQAEEERPSRKPVVLLCLVWIVTYLGFLFFFIPQATFYRLFYFPALIVLIGVGVNHLGPTVSRRLPQIVAIAALANFLFYIYPYSRVRPETPLALATQLQSVWSQRTVVFYSVITSDAQLAMYFNPKAVWIENDPPNWEELDDAVRAGAAEHDFWLETSLIRGLSVGPSAGAAWLEKHGLDGESFQVAGVYDVRFVRIRP